MALLRQAGVLNDGCGGEGGQAAGLQLCADVIGRADAHVDHEGEFGRMCRAGQSAPVSAAVSGLGVARDEHHPMSVLSVGQRCAQAA